MQAGHNKEPGEVGVLIRGFFGDFQYDGIELVPPTPTCTERHQLDVAGRPV
jgi:hypothetical protein